MMSSFEDTMKVCIRKFLENSANAELPERLILIEGKYYLVVSEKDLDSIICLILESYFSEVGGKPS